MKNALLFGTLGHGDTSAELLHGSYNCLEVLKHGINELAGVYLWFPLLPTVPYLGNNSRCDSSSCESGTGVAEYC